MNPAIIILALILIIMIWFLASKLYRPVGETVKDIIDSAIHEMTFEEECVGCIHLREDSNGKVGCELNVSPTCRLHNFTYRERKD